MRRLRRTVRVLSVVAASSCTGDRAPQDGSAPAAERAASPISAAVPACPAESFEAFVAGFADDPEVQRAWTSFPFEDAALAQADPEPRMQLDSLSIDEAEFPLMPSAAVRAIDSRELKIEDLPEGRKRVQISQPETDWVVDFIFAPTADCWRLVRREDWSL
jgi:hypothetical protein